MTKLENVLLKSTIGDDGRLLINGEQYEYQNDILKSCKLLNKTQTGIADFYDTHWKLPGAYDFEESHNFQKAIFQSMFPSHTDFLNKFLAKNSYVLDVGCGSGAAGRAYFENRFDNLNYVACDMSSAIEQAKIDFEALNINAEYVQAEIGSLPFSHNVFDVVFCPGVLHYTLNMGIAIKDLSNLIKTNGLFVSWIYKKQKPIRALTDQYLMNYFSNLTPEDSFEQMKALTKLGIELGKLNAEIEVEDIPVLGVSAGKYNLQRFFYYHIMKLFHNEDLPFVRHVVNNWNAYTPQHILFHSADEIRIFVESAGMEVLQFIDQGNGISITARKK